MSTKRAISSFCIAKFMLRNNYDFHVNRIIVFDLRLEHIKTNNVQNSLCENGVHYPSANNDPNAFSTV